MWQVGDKLGRFRLDREIGQGSHGVVWVATDTALNAAVALKILHPWLTQDTAVRDRFKRELLLARRIAHPGVCRLFDLHEEGEAFFITMDYVEGQTLLNILKNEGRLFPARGIKILRGICQALAAAHTAGVIHRDLKPANIIVRTGDSPMILDFGTATAQDVSRVTRPGTAVGSMRFIAPEVFTGVSPSVKSDIYSLGVVAYVTLAGKLPYNAAAGAIEMLEMIKNQPPLRIDVIQPDVPAALADIVARAMDKNPEARFETALAFDEALGALEGKIDLADAPTVSNRPPSGDFAHWAPSGVIRQSVEQTAAQTAARGAAEASEKSETRETPLPAGSASQLPEAPITVTNSAQAAQTMVDTPRPNLSLGTQIPSTPTGELPVVAGTLEPLGDPTGGDPPRGDTVEEPPVATLPSEPPRALEPTVRVAQFDLERGDKGELDGAERAAVRTGIDKRLLAAGGAAVAVILVVTVVALTRGSSEPAPAPARPVPVSPVPVSAAPVDAGTAATPAAPPAVPAVPAAPVDAAAAPPGAPDASPDAPPDDDNAMVFGAGDAEPKPKGTHARRGDPRIDDGIRQARLAMRQKGLLPADVPAAEQSLERAHFANARGNKRDAEKQLASAKAAIDAQAVDRAFVMNKLGRFTKAFDKSKRPDLAAKVDPLARKAGAAFAAGEYDAANKTLNAAFSLVARAR